MKQINGYFSLALFINFLTSRLQIYLAELRSGRRVVVSGRPILMLLGGRGRREGGMQGEGNGAASRVRLTVWRIVTNFQNSRQNKGNSRRLLRHSRVLAT